MPEDQEQDSGGPEHPEHPVAADGAVADLRKGFTVQLRPAIPGESEALDGDVLREKEARVTALFDQYAATRRAADEAVVKHPRKAAELAIALAKRDPATARALALRLAEGRKFEEAALVALELGDAALSAEIVKQCPAYNRPSSVARLAAAIGDAAPLKEIMVRWATRQYFPGDEEAIRMGSVLAEADPTFLRDFIETRLYNPEHRKYSEGKVVAALVAALAAKDPVYAREVMEKDLAYAYGGQIAGSVAVALGDRDAAKQAAEKTLKGSLPDTAPVVAAAIGDPDLAARAMENAKRFDHRTVAKAALALGDLDAAKEAVRGCIAVREQRVKEGKYDANSTDSGRNWEQEAGEYMVEIARADPAYGRELLERYFLAAGNKYRGFAGGAPVDTVVKIAKILAEKDPEAAERAARGLAVMENCKHHADSIMAEVFRHNVGGVRLSPAETVAILNGGSDRTALAVGWFVPPEALEGALADVEADTIRRSAQLGGVFNKQPGEYQRELADLAFSSPADPAFERALSRCLVHFDYEQVSGILLQKVKDVSDEKTLVRYLKTLVEIENPKGRTIASDLFANREVHPRLRRYLAGKLIAEGHWDKDLGPLLEARVKAGREGEADDTLVAMISELGLVPDKPAYEALEAPGLLEGATLEDRVRELKAMREEFATLALDGLKERLKDERIRKIYYLVKGGEYRYTLINDYSFQKFSLVVGKILDQQVDETKLAEFAAAMEAAGIEPDERTRILKEMREGRFPLKDAGKRGFTFDAVIEAGSEYEIAFARLQEVWGRELHALAAAQQERGSLPLGIDDALARLEGKEITDGKTKKVLEFLRHGQKQDVQSLRKLADACKKDLVTSLKQKAKHAEHKDAADAAMLALDRMNVSGLLQAYLAERLPGLKGSPILLEWESHLRETLSVLEAGPVKGAARTKRLELTFLDKGKDFVRSVRFADGRQCCFNSSNYGGTGELSAADWIAKLHADPLSCILDIKEDGSRIVSGFVFGRMGIDPKTKRPIVMLNGVYAQESGGAMAGNILKLIEDKHTRVIGASSQMIASKHGGTLSKAPDGYEKVSRDVQAVRALKNSDKVYDDIGTTSNGTFTFQGYERQLA